MIRDFVRLLKDLSRSCSRIAGLSIGFMIRVHSFGMYIGAHHLSPRGPSPTTEARTPRGCATRAAGARAAEIGRPPRATLDASALLECIKAAFMMSDAVVL